MWIELVARAFVMSGENVGLMRARRSKEWTCDFRADPLHLVGITGSKAASVTCTYGNE